jgi:hypothetical protein
MNHFVTLGAGIANGTNLYENRFGSRFYPSERLTGRAGRKLNLGCLPDISFRRAVIPGQKGAEDFTRSILSQILSEYHYQMSIFKY